MMSNIFLSHTINEITPSYGGGTSLCIDHIKDIKEGDSCNTQLWQLPNHLGTHVDAPRHFSEFGLTIDQYSPDFWLCKSPHIIELSEISPKEIITPNHFFNFSIPQNIDLLLIKTGFGAYRQDNRYIYENPGFAPELADYLREHFSDLKMLGFDIISLTSFAFRDVGRLTHKQFLARESPILPIEDMDLSNICNETLLRSVLISPLRIDNADAAPCTVFAELQDEKVV